MKDKPLLSLCIPTYNRAPYLDELLNRIGKQIHKLESEDMIELMVSDNCSDDGTQEVVSTHIERGLNIRYEKNKTNLGMDGNFVSCFKKATGKYIWLLGDDDYLVENTLHRILDCLNEEEIGLLHLKMRNNEQSITTFSNKYDFYTQVSYWITFISANIVNSKYVNEISFQEYMGTYFTLIPLYMTAANKERINKTYNYKSLDTGKDYTRNGGYNFFQVFVVNFLEIWKEMTRSIPETNKLYRYVKKDLYKNFLLPNIIKIIIDNKKGKYEDNNAIKILFKYYGLNCYAYKSLISKIMFRKICLLKSKLFPNFHLSKHY